MGTARTSWLAASALLRAILLTIVCAWIAGILSVPPSGASEEWFDDGGTIPVNSSDSLKLGQACRPVACAFYLVFETSPDAVNLLLGKDQPSRILVGKGLPFTPAAVRKRLIRLMAPSSDSLFLTAAPIQFSGDTHPIPFTNDRGNGFSFLLERRQHKTRISACVLESHSPVAGPIEAELRTSDLLLIRLNLESRHYVVAVLAPFLDPSNFDRDQARYRDPFLSGLAGQTSPSHWSYLRPGQASAQYSCSPQD